MQHLHFAFFRHPFESTDFGFEMELELIPCSCSIGFDVWRSMYFYTGRKSDGCIFVQFENYPILKRKIWESVLYWFEIFTGLATGCSNAGWEKGTSWDLRLFTLQLT